MNCDMQTQFDLVERRAASCIDTHAIVDRLYCHPARYGFTCEDDAADALSFHWRRIANCAIRTMKDETGYFDQNLRWIAHTMGRSRRLRQARLDVASIHLGWEARELQDEWRWGDAAGTVQDGEDARSDEFIASIPAECITSRLDTLSRRILYLFLSCAMEAGDAEVRMVARRLGIPVCWLAARTHDARQYVLAESERRKRESEQLASLWQQVRTLESQGDRDDDPVRASHRKRKLARARERYAAVCARLSRRKLLVPHSAVARILGVPKGSVDSGIYYLRAAMERGKLPV